MKNDKGCLRMNTYFVKGKNKERKKRNQRKRNKESQHGYVIAFSS